ncbi:retrovirus-related pol polyprotein from transposon TNT 1-94 [Tanacetum coccineum]
MQVARDRQKSYADLKRKPMEFQVGDSVGKGSYVLLELPQELGKVHNTFYVSNLKKCLANEPLAVPLDGLHIDDKLYFVEEPVVIMDHGIKQLKQSHVSIVKTVFDQIDVVVQQSSVDKQCLEIAKKELLLENDRLLQQIMSQDVLSTMMNYMSLIGDNVNIDGNRKEFCNLEAELLKSQNAFNDLLKKLENSVAKLLSENERLCNETNHVKHVFKEQFDSIKKTRVRSKEQSDSLNDKLNLKSAKNEDLIAQIQDKVFVITSLKNDLQKLKGKEIVNIAAQIPSPNTIVLCMLKLDLEPLAPRLLQNREMHIEYLKYTQKQADILRGIELLVYVQDTCPNAIKLSAKKVVVTPKNNVKKVRFAEPLKSSSNIKQVESSTTLDSNTHVLSPTGLKCSTDLDTLILSSKNANHSEPNHTWGSNATDIPSSSSLVMTVRFGNDHIVRIIGYGDYQLGNVTISRVYYVEGLGHNLFSVGQFCDGDLEVAFQKNTCFIRNLEGVDLLSRSRDTNFYSVSLDDMLKTSLIYNGTEFVNQTLREFYENVGISHQTFVAPTPQQNGIVERRNRTLIEVARTMLIFSKAPLFLWAEAINTTCYTQNRLIICCRYNKTPYELMQEKKPDVSFFHVFSALCYPTNDNDDWLWLLNNSVQDPDFNDRLFQPMFDEYFTPPPIVVTPVQEVVAPRAVVLADSPD